MSESSSSVVVGLQEGAIKQHCKLLHLPTIATQCASLAEQAERERQGYLGYLDVHPAPQGGASAKGQDVGGV
jgi:hypothetical protein